MNVWGNSATPEPKRNHAALLIENRTQKKGFVFFLRINRVHAKSEMRTKLFLVMRVLASGDWAERISFAQDRLKFCYVIVLFCDIII